MTPSRASSQPASATAPGPNLTGVASSVKTVSRTRSRSSAARSRGGHGTGRRVARSTNTCTNQPVAAGSSSPALNTASS